MLVCLNTDDVVGEAVLLSLPLFCRPIDLFVSILKFIDPWPGR